MDAFRAWTEVDLDALASNLAVIRRRAGAGRRVMLVVKQDAYGHGAVAVAHHAVRCGVGAFGVGSSSEALELREAGIRLPILVLGTIVEEELAACLRHQIHIGLHANDRVRSLAAYAQRTEQRARVHLNVDTGMGRLGVPAERAMALLRAVAEEDALELRGVMSHLAPPDGLRDPFAQEQVARFDQVLHDAARAGLLSGWVHMANSAGLFTGLTGSVRHGAFDTVRPGIAAYGALPAHLPGADELHPVIALRSRVVFLKDVPASSPVGYGSTWRSPVDTRIATLAIGYGHGLPWTLRGGEVLLGGRRAPIVGRLSMDYITVDVGHLPGVQVGDVATLIGMDGEEVIGLEEVAARSGTIAYEVSCALGRLPRLHLGGRDLPIPAQSPALRPPSGPPVPQPGQPSSGQRS
ncbi:MAG: alanine racemase [Planctomycetota bacterium]|nr:alanine racemase [Planctomycetota bacterium]